MLGWQLVQEILQGLPEEDLRSLIGLLEAVRGRAFDYLYPGKVMKEVKVVDEPERMARFLARMANRDVSDQGNPDLE